MYTRSLFPYRKVHMTLFSELRKTDTLRYTYGVFVTKVFSRSSIGRQSCIAKRRGYETSIRHFSALSQTLGATSLMPSMATAEFFPTSLPTWFFELPQQFGRINLDTSICASPFATLGRVYNTMLISFASCRNTLRGHAKGLLRLKFLLSQYQ